MLRGYGKDGVCGKGSNMVGLLVVMLALIALPLPASALSIDNTCTFKSEGKLFTLAVLNKHADTAFYRQALNSTATVVFNFCDPFVPQECTAGLQKAYSFIVVRTSSGDYKCQSFSSDSKTAYFTPQYLNEKGEIKMNLSMTTRPENNTLQRATDFILDCQESKDAALKGIRAGLEGGRLVVYGSTSYACPVFELSSIWRALTDNLLIFGVVLFIVGFIMLFFGIMMTHLMIFIAAYFLSFAVLTMVFSAFLAVDSSTLAIYFCLLLIMFLSTLFAYGLTRLVGVSIFFIGAFFGFILAAILNSIFCKVFDIYSVWSLVVFQICLTIPFGLLTFKYSEEVIVMSTSLAGSYMMVRPFSWMLGGFPNEFTLYLMIENGEIKTVPWAFFIYLAVIIALAIIGALYQLLKIKRRTPNLQVEANFITESVEGRIDRIKEAVEKIIKVYAPDPQEDQYKQMSEMEEIKGQPSPGIEAPAKTQERKSREENF